MREHGGSRSVAARSRGAVAVRVAGRLALAAVCAGMGDSAFGQTPGGSNSPHPSSPVVKAIDNPLNIPDVRGVLPKAVDREGMGISLQILVLMTVLTLVPSILIMTTCFARILIVLALLRQALSTPQLPPSQVILGLALFMTLLIMGPTLGRINREALQPYLNEDMPQLKALEIAAGHMRKFMFAQIERNGNDEDIFLFQDYAAGKPAPAGPSPSLEDVPTTTLIPAFILSELKTAFIMGFRIYLPFLVIDMVIATILISMGMMMLPPVLISLPFKILLFVIADGWRLIVQTLMYSFDNLSAVT